MVRARSPEAQALQGNIRKKRTSLLVEHKLANFAIANKHESHRIIARSFKTDRETVDYIVIYRDGIKKTDKQCVGLSRTWLQKGKFTFINQIVMNNVEECIINYLPLSDNMMKQCYLESKLKIMNKLD